MFFSTLYLDSTTAEALGARQGAEFGLFLGLQSLILEGDALEIVMALGSDDKGVGYYGNLIVETRGILMGFLSWTVQHVGRDANKATHCLAKFAVSNQLNHVWIDSYPLSILGIVNAELNLSDRL